MNATLHVLIAYNLPLKDGADRDAASEAGVLDSVAAIESALLSLGHRVSRLGVAHRVEPLADSLTRSRPDVVFNLVESFGGKPELEPAAAALYELFGVPFTGSKAACLSLVRNKALAKSVFRGCGIPTPESWTAPAGAELLQAVALELNRGPLIVKPACADASEGVSLASVVEDEVSLRRQVRRVHAEYGDALIERFIDGREFNVGILDLSEPVVLPLAEMEFELSAELPWRVITYDAKWTPDSPEDRKTQVRCPALVTPELGERIRRTALDAYRAVGARHYARVDIRVDRAGAPFVLEVNANPDLDPQVGLARELRAGGWSYEQFIGRLVEYACTESQAASSTLGLRSAANSPPSTKDGLRPTDSQPHIRTVRPDDVSRLLGFTDSTGMFRTDEIETARELLEASIREGHEPHGYRSLALEIDGMVVAWSCHGLTPLTDGAYDLYWIVVDPKHQGRGLGKRLIAAVEADVRRLRGRWLFAETSSQTSYEPTRRFYARCGYQPVRETADFYRAGDGLIVFGKRIDVNR